jgi:hypothetical protein
MCLAKDKHFGFVNVGQGKQEGNTKFDRKNETSRAVVRTNHVIHCYSETSG